LIVLQTDIMTINTSAVILIPCGPCSKTILDTAESIDHYCSEPHEIVFVDDCTSDGTYDVLLAAERPNWHILRNKKRHGFLRLVHTLCFGLRYIQEHFVYQCVLKLDADSLMTGSGVLSDAFSYMKMHLDVGMFGVYEVDYNKPRTFTAHKQQMDNALAWWRPLVGLRPAWTTILQVAESKGYRRGENVSGGGYFITKRCLDTISHLGYLNVPYRWYSPVVQFCLDTIEGAVGKHLPYSWHGRLAEDVYFSMSTVAAGYKLGHFAAPDGPICVAPRGLPYPAKELLSYGYKIVHEPDKGPNTSASENGGVSAREFFRIVRESQKKERKLCNG
jgi:glycosyltransferase involved in cell wall biosynthesis